MSQTYFYSDEKNVQILVALLKAYNIRYVVASPGTTNINFVWSVQRDNFFKVFSAVDERHAAYLACGMAGETGEPVVITCTGATASRDYFPGLTEAYYRKLPILAVTSSQRFDRVGNLSPQMLDRTSVPNDAVKYSYQCAIPHDAVTTKACELNLNKALIELTRHGGGPVHINLETSYSATFSTETLPIVRKISHTTLSDKIWPSFPEGKRIAIWLGAHKPFSKTAVEALEAFAERYNAVVFVDKTSNYAGRFAVNASFLSSQGIGGNANYAHLLPEHLIHMGEISGDYPTAGMVGSVKSVWRVNEDGELRDLFGKLTAAFEMSEEAFFQYYAEGKAPVTTTYLEAWQTADADLRARIPEIPFSNPWMAQKLLPLLPKGSTLHLGILNSLRSWNLFLLPQGVTASCNVGGFGIDGNISTMLGASFVAPEKTFFAVVGDLAFFYDLNALGNRHVGKNVRILLINNATGAEFHIYNHPAAKFGEDAGCFMAADGHYGNKSPDLVRHYVTDLGLTYLSAKNKEEFEVALPAFLGHSDKAILLECFTDANKESEAHRQLNSIIQAPLSMKSIAKSILPQGVKNILKKVIK